MSSLDDNRDWQFMDRDLRGSTLYTRPQEGRHRTASLDEDDSEVCQLRSRKILAFRKARKLTQDALAKRLNTSAMNVSRWERGEAEPTADAYIRFGHLAVDPLCWFFWQRAGLSTSDLMHILPVAR